MKTIAFYNVKGGVSKTMSTINVGAILANEGKRVLIVDLDPQGKTTDFFKPNLDFDKDPSLLSIKNLLDDFDSSAQSIQDVIYHTDFTNLDLVPAAIRLGKIQNQMMLDTTMPQQFRVKNYLADIADEYDYCILDCHPAAETLLNVNALVAADYVFTPIRANKWAMKGIDYLFEVFQTVKKINNGMHFGGAFITAFEDTVVGKYTIDQAMVLGDKFMNTRIPKATIADQISYLGVPLIHYAPKEKITLAYIELVKEIKSIMGGSIE